MFRNISGKLQEYFKFSKEELFSILLATILFGFMLSFRDWGKNIFSVKSGISAWVISSGIFFLLYMVYLSIIKIIAIWKGYKAEFKLSKTILGIALFLTFMSEGLFILLIPGSIYFNYVKKHRLGKLKMMKYSSFGYIGTISSLFLILIGALFAPLYGVSLIFEKIVVISLLIAIFSMLPIPSTTGFYLIIISYINYFTTLGAVLIAALFAYLEVGVFFTLIITLFISAFIWILLFKYLE